MAETSFNWVGTYYELCGPVVVEYCPLPAFCLLEEAFDFDLEAFTDY